ncbi:bifunctional 2-polyprenyl-6-hydroxyphenol methylase/3-demethylubiquinol 3-O-methyltransferase UbiG [Phenylobacterium sp.]|uniref:class I SAM-dependent methyltransferase n=1 Tax=Phenylobacterium sp. TaxID=1871053 RepID=UPI002730990B|nr:class I SAM-dependent methyltransferase [Phenylobacterium sp.]MDP1598232.1 class I SAM-dependent methyltransferase [Phenylobacterium sp.]MDP3594704.1 class I SAM-dependent methyltransferase [Phenylobacterium sp.]
MAAEQNETSETPSVVETAYQAKPVSYFANARRDIVALLETGPEAAILELGCGAGGTGRAVIAAGKCGRYVGIELNSAAAREAAQTLTEVVVGDVHDIALASYETQFDALIISEVLEHLLDPWETLARLSVCLKPGGKIYASSPNVAHWQVIKELFLGRFRYTEVGIMDRTHLRWFTPDSYREMFEAAGLTVESVEPLVPPRWKARLAERITGGRFAHLFAAQIMLVGRR